MKTLLLQNESETSLKQLIEFTKKLGIKTNLVADYDWWDELSKDEQKEIKLGLSQADNNNFIDHKNVMNRFDTWTKSNLDSSGRKKVLPRL